ELLHLLAGGNAELLQGGTDAIVDQLLDTAPLVARLAGDVLDLALDLLHLLAGARLELFTTFDQGLQHLRTLLLHRGQGAEPGQPDLAHRLLQFLLHLGSLHSHLSHLLVFSRIGGPSATGPDGGDTDRPATTNRGPPVPGGI